MSDESQQLAEVRRQVSFLQQGRVMDQRLLCFIDAV